VKVAVGFSGGVDSTVLLFACRAAGVPVTAIHINHGLHASADAWEANCRERCAAWRIPFIARRVSVTRQGGESLEAEARTARYTALAQVMGECAATILLTGHHQDDQLETSLLALLRGSGLAGLAGMQPVAAWPLHGATYKNLHIVRPLLTLSKAAILRFAATQGLSTIDDPSNADPALRRNALRIQILPLIETAFPQYRASLTRLARQVGELRNEWQAEAAAVLPTVLDPDERLRIHDWLALPTAVRLRVLRAWLATRTIRLSEAQTFELARQLAAGTGGERRIGGRCRLHIRRGRAGLYWPADE
jgi:tRNA(Ile)-lysidine synthase